MENGEKLSEMTNNGITFSAVMQSSAVTVCNQVNRQLYSSHTYYSSNIVIMMRSLSKNGAFLFALLIFKSTVI